MADRVWPPAVPARRPGDSDGMTRGTAGPMVPPLGPGDGDSEAVAGEARPPLGPGDGGEEADFDLVTQPPAGPGGVSITRRIVRIPRKVRG